MASAQVASGSSKKQDLLEAGRRRLEEFRKKKAAGKKTGVPKQSHTPDSSLAEKQTSENEEAPDCSATSGMTDGVTGTYGFPDSNDKEYGISHDSGSEPIPQAEARFQNGNVNSPEMLHKQVDSLIASPELDNQSCSTYVQRTYTKTDAVETSFGEGRHAVAISSGRPSGLQDDNSHDFHTYFYGDHKDVRSSEGLATDLLLQNHVPDSVDSSRGFQASTRELSHNQQGVLAVKNHLPSHINEKGVSDALGSLWAVGSQLPSDSISGGSHSDIRNSANDIITSAAADTYSRRSRPSFLDSLNVGRDFPATGRTATEDESSTTSKLPNSNFVTPSWIQDSYASSAPVEPLPTPIYSNKSDDLYGSGFREQTMFEKSLESKLNFNSQRQNEDFAALEQHIEDLTQEKFSLQRAMEASKALAESLAAENSSLTESYNQQAGIVNQLKAEMDRLQGEIKARLVELEAIKAEYMNASLECNAADERAKLLASEVISLEEKALRLRSSELKLERELENSNAELASYKKKLSSLDKELRDLQQTVDALQEEKKLLQSKLRRASTSGISIDVNRGQTKKDASTSTNDLKDNPDEASSNIQRHEDAENLLLLLQDRSAGFEDVATTIPPDQVQMIQNINSLMTEIMSEKEELMQALIDEVSTSAKLKDLNKELSYKLEVQTQRLELLTAQNMASENIPAGLPANSRTERENVAYADEGDEVVERVLGWIMKLFPGGPSKRRTSRL